VAKKPRKQVLRALDLTTLLVALDHLEEHGPPPAVPDPYAAPAECVYLAHVGADHLAALTARLPHATVLFRTPADGPKGKVVRPVFDKAALLYVLRFCFSKGNEFAPFVRDLRPINPRRWSVLDADGNTVRRPKKNTSEGPTSDPT
jgi:hypothetical protein